MTGIWSSEDKRGLSSLPRGSWGSILGHWDWQQAPSSHVECAPHCYDSEGVFDSESVFISVFPQKSPLSHPLGTFYRMKQSLGIFF